MSASNNPGTGHNHSADGLARSSINCSADRYRALLRGSLALTAAALVIGWTYPVLSALQGNTTAADVSTEDNASRSVVVAELTGDGSLDLIVANEVGRNQLFRGDGMGGFAAGENIDNSGAGLNETSDSVDAADVDGDGDLDLIFGSRSDNPNILYLNNGSGSFTRRGNTGLSDPAWAGRDTSSVRFGDINNDGDPDVVVANRGPQNQTFLGDPSGPGFPSADMDNLDDSGGGKDSSSASFGDIDNDGDLDLVIGNRRNTQNDLYVNSFVEDGSLFGARLPLGQNQSYTDWIELVDINNDGDLDVIVGNKQQPNYYQLGNGDKTFQGGLPISDDADYTRDIRAVDVDGDGDRDIIVANDSTSFNKVYLNLLVESGALHFGDGIQITTDQGESIAMALSDFDGDSDIDLVVANNGSPNRIYFNNNEDPEFSSTAITGATAGDTYTYQVAAADADRGQALTITAPTLPGSGWLSLTDNGDGTALLTGTPAAGDVGGNAVSLLVSDGTLTDTQDFTLTVDATNAGPQFTSTPPTADITQGNSGTPFDYDITSTDADDAALVLSATTLPSWLTLTDAGDGTGNLAGTPTQDNVGPQTIVLRVTDPMGRADEQSFSFNVLDGNDRPVTSGDAIQMAAGATVTQLGPAFPELDATSVLWNDYDPDGDTLTAELVAGFGPTAGTLTLNADGTFQYVNDIDPTALSDSFRYRANDGNGGRRTATVSINIGGGNSAPIAVEDNFTAVRGQAVLNDPEVLGNDTDADGDTLTAELVTGPANDDGNFILNADGTFSYTHDGSATTTDSFTYRANDGQAVSNTVTVTITINPPDDQVAPVITLLGNANVTVVIGGAYVDEGATATDDVDGDITANIVTVNPVDTATLGSYTVTYNVTDAAGNAATEVTRAVEVVAVADTTPPVITLNGNATVTLTVGDSYTDAGATATDNVDGDITANIVTVNPVNTAAAGTYTVTYNVSDGAGNAATEVTRSVTVNAVIVPPPPPPPPPPSSGGGGGSAALLELLGLMFLVGLSRRGLRRTRRST